jgi:hypothetical protein
MYLMNSTIYFIGGFGEHDPIVDCEVYDCGTNTKKPLPDLPFPLSCVSITEMHGLLYIIGYQSEGILTYSL